jgi:hypothetical protein
MEQSHLWKELLEVNSPTETEDICVPYGEEYKRINYRSRNIQRVLEATHRDKTELVNYYTLVRRHACDRDYDAALECIKTFYTRVMEILGIDLAEDEDDLDEYEGLQSKLDKLINAIDLVLMEANEWDMDSAFFNERYSLFFHESVLAEGLVSYIERVEE